MVAMTRPELDIVYFLLSDTKCPVIATMPEVTCGKSVAPRSAGKSLEERWNEHRLRGISYGPMSPASRSRVGDYHVDHGVGSVRQLPDSCLPQIAPRELHDLFDKCEPSSERMESSTTPRLVVQVFKNILHRHSKKSNAMPTTT